MRSNKFFLAATALLLSFGAFSQQQSDSTKKDTSVRRTDSTKMDTTKKSPDLQSTTTGSQGQQQGSTQPSTTVTGTGSTPATGAAGSTTTTGTGSSNTTGATTTTGSTTATGTDNATSTTGSAATTSGSTSSVSSTPKPNFGRYYIPVLGTYTATATSNTTSTTSSTSTASTSVKITPDESNPGKVWVEGLSASRFYALLKTAPGTYKIPAQKADNISVAEGTLIYDDNSKQITVCTGCGYNEQAPAVGGDVATSTSTSTEGSSKTSKKGQQNLKTKKVPVVTFTGTKADQGTVSLLQ